MVHVLCKLHGQIVTKRTDNRWLKKSAYEIQVLYMYDHVTT